MGLASSVSSLFFRVRVRVQVGQLTTSRTIHGHAMNIAATVVTYSGPLDQQSSGLALCFSSKHYSPANF